MKRQMFRQLNNRGFTLIELLVAMVISGIVMTSIYSAYYSQQKSFINQEQVVAMQQNLRAGMELLEREIRMAGYDREGTSDAGIFTAEDSSIRIKEDLDGDGLTSGSNEDITYSLYDYGGDGDTDLGRDTGGGNQPLAENIDALNFVYLRQDGTPLSTPVAALGEIRSVQIAIVARTGRRDPGYTNNKSYQNFQGTTIYTAPGDNFRRKFLRAEIQCRNLGF
jgi:type IV pilus assembly protein PilW